MSFKQEKKCEYHGGRPAVAKCKVCGRNVCRYCAQVDGKGKPICRPCCVARGVRQKRSVGVTVLGILDIIGGGTGVAYLPLVLLIWPVAQGSAGAEWAIPGYKAWNIAKTVLDFCISGALLVSGIWLLMLRDWARRVTVVLEVCTLIWMVMSAVPQFAWIIPARAGAGHPVSAFSVVTSDIIGVAVCVLYIVFFTRPMVKAQFGRQLKGWTPARGPGA